MIDLIEHIKQGRFKVIFCEPLAEFFDNLKFCPYKEECEQLSKELERTWDCTWIQEMMYCDFCERDEWIIIGAYIDDGKPTAILGVFTVKSEYGEEVKKYLKKLLQVER